MTCIVGMIADGRIYMGGDSAGVSDWSLMIRADRKVFRNGPFLIGFTSSFRMGQLLEHAFSPPARRIEQDVYAYMVTDFIDSVRYCLKNGGFAETNNGVEKGGEFLVGYERRIFYVASDYQVGESVDGMAACGCGREIALGALFATPTVSPIDRVRIALEAAERLSAGVRAPFHIEEMS
jgi:ATP-dependent protease HslVU (ClpYQ) peptidase subunit